jgi:hypothetical protein
MDLNAPRVLDKGQAKIAADIFASNCREGYVGGDSPFSNNS